MAAEASALARLAQTALAPGTGVWGEAAFASMIADPARLILRDDDMRALIVLGVLPPEAEVLTLGVAPDHRRQGVGAALMEAAVKGVRARGVDRMILEVAEDNDPAHGLYRRFGFSEIARRKAYYPRPAGRIDALLLERRL